MDDNKRKFNNADRKGMSVMLVLCLVLAVLIALSVCTRNDTPPPVPVPPPVAATADSLARVQDTVVVTVKTKSPHKPMRRRKIKPSARPPRPHERDYMLTPEQEAKLGPVRNESADKQPRKDPTIK